MFQDLRYGVRMLFKHKGFTIVAALTLSLGIGANTAIFSLLDAVLLKSLPVRQPDRLVLFGKGWPVGMTNGFPNASWDLFSYPFYQEVRQRSEVFSGVAALRSFPNTLHGIVNADGAGGELEQIIGQLVSGDYFSLLGVNAGLGRVFTEADDQISGGHPLAVLSHSWWKRRFGGDPAVIGKIITISQRPYTIIGVAAPEFFGTTVGQSPDLWLPLAMEAQLPPYWNGREDRDSHSLLLIARLKDGVTTQQAGVAVNLRFKQHLREWAGELPSAKSLQDIQLARIDLTPAGRGLSELRRDFSLPLRLLMAVAGIVLLIACANIANLLLARSAARRKEFAVRLALGAGRARLFRQLFIESALLAALGGAAGVLLAWWGSRVLIRMVSAGSQPLPLDVALDARVLAFTLLASLLSALVFGTAPALRAAGVELIPALKGGKGAASATARNPLGKALVVAQVALSLLLLVGAGLFVRTLINLQSIDTGFDGRNVLLFTIDTTAAGYKEDASLAALFRNVEEKVKTIPGVGAASFAVFAFNQGGWSMLAFTRNPGSPAGGDRTIQNNAVGPDYFSVLGLPIKQGRGFDARDTERSRKVAVISEEMARRFFPGESPIGKRFGFTAIENSEKIEVIGVVKDAKYGSLDETPQPMVYHSYRQYISYLNNFEVRFNGAPSALIPLIRRAIREVNPNLPIDEVVPLAEHVERSLIQPSLVARLSTFFGLLALLLACVGLYGILSYAVAQCTGEIGIRMALGAQTGDVLWLVLLDAAVLVLIGVGIGLAVSLAVTKTASSLLFGLQPNDPLTIASAVLLLATVAALAGYLPARRATRICPMAALREE